MSFWESYAGTCHLPASARIRVGPFVPSLLQVAIRGHGPGIFLYSDCRIEWVESGLQVTCGLPIAGGARDGGKAGNSFRGPSSFLTTEPRQGWVMLGSGRWPLRIRPHAGTWTGVLCVIVPDDRVFVGQFGAPWQVFCDVRPERWWGST